jgi:MFS family permease
MTMGEQPGAGPQPPVAPQPSVRERPTAWGQIALLGVAELIVSIGFGAILPYLPVYLNEEGGARVATIGVIAAAAFLGMALFSGPFGRLSDVWGRKPLIVGGFGLSAVALLLFVTTTHPAWFVLFRFIEGLGFAMAAPAVNALVGDLTSDANRSRAFGWIGTAQFGGLILGPAVAVVLYEGLGGGLWAFRALFLVGSACSALITVLLAIRLREPPRPARDRVKDKREGHKTPARAILTKPILAFFLLGATGSYCVGGFEVLWSLWLRHLGASMRYVGATWVAFSIPMLLSFAGGWLADRTNRFLLMMIGFGTSSVIWVLYGTTENLTFFLALNALEGLAIAFAWPAREAFLVQVSPPRLLGTVMGVEQTAMQSATVVGTLLAPLLYERYAGFALSIGGLVGLAGLAVAGPVLGREWKRLKAAGETAAKTIDVSMEGEGP